MSLVSEFESMLSEFESMVNESIPSVHCGSWWYMDKLWNGDMVFFFVGELSGYNDD